MNKWFLFGLLVLVVAVVAGCGGGGGGGSSADIVTPARLVVGSEATYDLSGSMSDGTTTKSISGTATWTVTSAGLPPLNGLNPWRMQTSVTMNIEGEGTTSATSAEYIAQDVASGQWYMIGIEEDGNAGLFRTWTSKPVMVPSPLQPCVKHWQATYADNTTVGATVTTTGPESVSTPLGNYSAYKVSFVWDDSDSKYESWYSPDIAWPVRSQRIIKDMQLGDGVYSGVISYTIKNQRMRAAQ